MNTHELMKFMLGAIYRMTAAAMKLQGLIATARAEGRDITDDELAALKLHGENLVAQWDKRVGG